MGEREREKRRAKRTQRTRQNGNEREERERNEGRKDKAAPMSREWPSLYPLIADLLYVNSLILLDQRRATAIHKNKSDDSNVYPNQTRMRILVGKCHFVVKFGLKVLFYYKKGLNGDITSWFNYKKIY